MLSYKIDKKNKLLIEKYEGELSIDDMIAHKEEELNDPDFEPDLDVITDITNANFTFNLSIIKKYTDYLIEKGYLIGGSNCAIIIATPHHATNSIKFIELLKEIQNNIDIFSTYEAAMNWIMSFKY
jgi:hypothetical protein